MPGMRGRNMRVSRIHRKNKANTFIEDVINNIMDFFAKPIYKLDNYIDSKFLRKEMLIKEGLKLNE